MDRLTPECAPNLEEGAGPKGRGCGWEREGCRKFSSFPFGLATFWQPKRPWVSTQHPSQARGWGQGLEAQGAERSHGSPGCSVRSAGQTSSGCPDHTQELGGKGEGGVWTVGARLPVSPDARLDPARATWGRGLVPNSLQRT